jgi:hypothetical protein
LVTSPLARLLIKPQLVALLLVPLSALSQVLRLDPYPEMWGRVPRLVRALVWLQEV